MLEAVDRIEASAAAYIFNKAIKAGKDIAAGAAGVDKVDEAAVLGTAVEAATTVEA